jgi:GntR family transcriptional regulator
MSIDPQAEGALFQASERFVLDAGSPLPLYHQMEQVVLDRITRPDALGRMLPPEKDLMQIFGVSRATVKKTLENLVAKGLVQRRRALGTRVIRQQITEDLARLTSYTEEMEKQGLRVSTQTLEINVHAADPYTCQKLQLSENDQVVSIKRLRGTSEFFPVVLFHSQLPMSLGIRPDEDFSGSLYRLLEQGHGIPIEWAEEEIRAAKPSDEEAQLLRLKRGEGVLVMERVTFTRGNRPLEFVRGVYRPEHYKYSIRLRR